MLTCGNPTAGEQRIPQGSWLASQAEILSSMLSKRRRCLNNVECDKKEPNTDPYTRVHMILHSNVLTHTCTCCHIQMSRHTCTHTVTFKCATVHIYTHATTFKCSYTHVHMLWHPNVPCCHIQVSFHVHMPPYSTHMHTHVCTCILLKAQWLSSWGCMPRL